jgi:TonB family protein
MLLIPSHPVPTDDSPLALLRRRRSEAEAELPRSVALSALLFLTAVVLVMVATSVLDGGRVMTWTTPPVGDLSLPPANDLGKYFTEPGVVPVAPDRVPPDPGPLVPVEDALITPDAPASIEPGRGIVEGPPGAGETGDARGTPGGGGPEGLPAQGEFVYYEVAPVAVQKVVPDYPAIAQQAGIEGTVKLLVLVGRDGHVADATVQTSIPMLDDAALSAVRRWRFSPALSSGHPVAVWIALPVTFTLH